MRNKMGHSAAHLGELDDVLDAINPHKRAIRQLLHGVPCHDVAVLIKQVCRCLRQPTCGAVQKADSSPCKNTPLCLLNKESPL